MIYSNDNMVATKTDADGVTCELFKNTEAGGMIRNYDQDVVNDGGTVSEALISTTSYPEFPKALEVYTLAHGEFIPRCIWVIA